MSNRLCAKQIEHLHLKNTGWHRSYAGSTLAMTIALAIVITIIGIAIFHLIEIMGGNRELQNAVDSGALNIAKQAAVSPGVKLQSAAEIENFGDLLDTNGMVTLRTYNRLVGRALLVGLNAQKQNTPAALDHAKTVLGLVQTNSDSIGKRLHDVLVNAGKHSDQFDYTAHQNNTRMVSSDAAAFQQPDFDTAYMARGEASNIYLDQRYVALLPKSSLSDQKSSSGEPYIKGYTPVDLGGGLVYYFVPLQSGATPHLVSKTDFAGNRTPVLSDKLPPNAFKAGGTVALTANANSSTLHSLSCAISVTAESFKPALPGGYIKVVNPKGYNVTTVTAPADSLFSDELASGIYLASDDQGKVVGFSLDPNALTAWAAYNKNGQVGTKPPFNDNDGNPLVFSVDGSVADMSSLSKIRGLGQPVTGCNYMNVSGPNGVPICPTCNALLPAFQSAYPHDEPAKVGDPAELMAVEKFRNDAETDFVTMMQQYERGINPQNQQQQMALNGMVEASSTCCGINAADGPTGLRVFDRHRVYPVELGSKVSTAGTVDQLLNQVGGNAPNVLSELKTKILQIKPDATQQEINALLANVTLDLNSVHWIYMVNPDSTRQLVFSVNQPPNLVTYTPPDGTPQTYSSGDYGTLRLLVDPIDENGWNHRWTYVTASDGTQQQIYYARGSQMMTNWVPLNVATGDDQAVWTPGSGFNGNEGVLQFQNVSSGNGTFCGMN